MRFDWYSATIRDEAQSVIERVAFKLDATVENSRPKNGYASAHVLRREGRTVGTMLSGGRNGWPHLFASGGDTDRLVPVVRGAWPDRHTVTRMDVAEDFDGPGTWDRLAQKTLEIADEKRLKINQAGDWHRKIDGRTLYIGAPSSAVRARLYEKGIQLRGEALDGGPEISTDLVRLEVQVRPEGAARQHAASCSPEAAYGYADWTQELARRVFALEIERVRIKELRESDNERALEFMAKQYGAHMQKRADELGGWGNLGYELYGRHQRHQMRKEGRDV